MAGSGKELRRRNPRKSSGGDASVEPLDEDEQTAMIEQLRAESIQQTQSILRIFRFLCLTAAVVVLLSVLYLDQWYMASRTATPQNSNNNHQVARVLSIAHGVSSAVLHGLSPHLIQPQEIFVRVAMVVDVLVASGTLFAARRDDTDDDNALLWMHYGILSSNVFVVVAAILIRWDGQSTERVLHDLQKAQYRYKSL